MSNNRGQTTNYDQETKIPEIHISQEDYLSKAGAYVLAKLQPLEVVLVWARRPENLIIICVCFLMLCWLLLRFIRWTGRKPFVLQVRDPRKSHRWQEAEFVDKPTYCSTCNELCVTGSSCEMCGLCTCARAKCLTVADGVQSCKPLSTRDQKWCHFWVKGNLPLFSLCFRSLSLLSKPSLSLNHLSQSSLSKPPLSLSPDVWLHVGIARG